MSNLLISPSSVARVEVVSSRRTFNLSAGLFTERKFTADIINVEATRKRVYLGIYPEAVVSQPIIGFTGTVQFRLKQVLNGEIPFTISDVPSSGIFMLNPFGGFPFNANGGVIPPDGIVVGTNSGFRLLVPYNLVVHCDQVVVEITNSVISQFIQVTESGLLSGNSSFFAWCTQLPVIPGSVHINVQGLPFHDEQTAPNIGTIYLDSDPGPGGAVQGQMYYAAVTGQPGGRIEFTTALIQGGEPYTLTYRVPLTPTSSLYRLDLIVVNQYPY